MKRTVIGLVATVAALLPASSHVASATIIHHPLIRSARGTATSTNWSGYATYNSTFTDVKGSWIQPTATCTSSARQYASFWVGIDGYKSSSVEQLGTDSDCSGGRPLYYAWWEMYPNPSNTISGFTVHAGDSISAEVKAVGTSYTLSLVNNTTHQTFSTVQSGSFAQSSAEWVAEAPSSCIVVWCRVLPLANFGTVNFTGSYTTGGGVEHSISGFTNDKITMATATGTVKAQPGTLSTDGTSFSDTWKHT